MSPSPLKRFEHLLKRLGALLLALLFWRPGRRSRAALAASAPRRVLLVRIDERVGEALLLTPLISALQGRPSIQAVDVLVHPRCARVLEGLPGISALRTFDRRGPMALFRLRREAEGYDVVVDCGNWSEPSVGSALVSRWMGARSAVLGPAVAPLAPLRTHPVAPRPDTGSEVLQRLHLLSPLGPVPTARLSFRKPRPGSAVLDFVRRLPEGPYVVVNPGGRLGWRRVPPAVFAEAAREALAHGRLPLVTWGPGEESLATRLCADCPGAVQAPPTSLDDLAWLMKGAAFTVCNNTGPMHLSVAVGTPTLAFFLHMDLARWGHSQPPHRMVDLTPLAGRTDEMGHAARAEVATLVASLPSARSTLPV